MRDEVPAFPGMNSQDLVAEVPTFVGMTSIVGD